MTLVAPTVHRNGTHGPDLLEGVCAAKDTVETAIAALQAAAPNGRDYYVQGPDAYAQACREHCARLNALRDVASDLEAMSIRIADQL